MFEFLQNIPMSFYYGMLAASLFMLVLSVVVFFIFVGDIVYAIISGILWPVSLGVVLFMLCVEGYDNFIIFLHSRLDNVSYFEKKNKENHECSDTDIIVDIECLNDVLVMYSILKEHGIHAYARPTILWNIYPKSRRVIENVPPASYKLSFADVEDKATFQFFWESLKDDK